MGPWITWVEVVRWLLLLGIAVFGALLGALCIRGPCWARRHRGGYLVGVVGKARHGKDSIGNVLLDHGFMKEAFAKPVKDAVKAIWDFSDQQLYGSEAQKNMIDQRWGVSPRQAMQFFGTEVGRDALPKLMPQFGSGFWVEHLRLRLLEHLKRHKEDPTNHSSNVVVCDVRFPNEAKLIRDRGGLIVRVRRPELDQKEDEEKQKKRDEQRKDEADEKQPDGIPLKLGKEHRSETLMDEITEDILVLNDGTLDDLQHKVESTVIPMISIAKLRKPKRTPKAE